MAPCYSNEISEISFIHNTMFCIWLYLSFFNKNILLLSTFRQLAHLFCLFMPFFCVSISPQQRTAKHLRNAVPMFAETRVALHLVTSTSKARRGQWGCRRRPPVRSSCVASRVLSATSGTASPCASAATAARGSPTSPVPPTA